ncbi:MAG TPA: methyl-accepting chemotaxis protein [Gammaproteobacteria bacterium]|nr:methyl-accepting chemotaxis protein [Gammaproteobacteria bacterium]
MSDFHFGNKDAGHKSPAPPRIPAHQWRLLLPLALLLLAAAAYLIQSSHEQSEQTLRLAILHQSELASRVAASAIRATDGATDAFFELRRIRTRAAAALAALELEPAYFSQPEETAALRAKLEDLKSLWSRVNEALGRLLEAETASATVRRNVEAFQSIATGVLVTADELVDAMVAADEPPAQIRAASRQLLLIQRISSNVRRVLESGDGMITAADRFGRDAVHFGEVNNALLVGSPEMKLKRVRDDAAREILVDIGREFRRSADLIEQIMSDAATLANARSTTTDIIADSERIAALSREIEAGLAASGASRLPLQGLIQISGALAVLSMLLAIGQIAAATRRARIETRRLSARAAAESAERAQRESAIEARELATENAIRRLIDELDRLSRGEAPTAVELKEAYSGTSLAPLEVAVSAVRKRFASLAQAAARVSAAGGRFVGVAKAARGMADEQRHHVEQAAKATRIMAAQVESVSDHGRAAGELVAQSLERARRATTSLDTAGGQAQQTLSAARNAATRIRQLNESTRQIQEIGRIMDELSEQCRILSLNLSIRASLAQESAAPSANGFSNDVQKLAADARRALKRIEDVNDDVRAHAGHAADSIKQLIWAAENSVEQNRTALNEISGVTRLAERLDTTHRALTDALEEHTVRMTQVVKSTTSVHQVTSRARGEIRDCAESAGRLSELAGLLETALTGYDERKQIHGSIIELPALGTVSRTATSEDGDAGMSKTAVGRDPA